MAALAYLGAGRLADARRVAALLEETTEGLTPHHRLHGIANRVNIAARAGCWDAIRELTSRVKGAVEANLTTPCPMNVQSLLNCAVANAQHGNTDEAGRLEQKADAIGMEGYGFASNPQKLALALVRDDLAELRRLVDAMAPEELEPWAFGSRAPLFDALVALDDRERIESEAPEYIRPRTYVEPFALRALGTAREDQTLIKQAAARFEAMGLAWHSKQTQKLLT